MNDPTLGRSARIIENARTRDGMTVAQRVRTADNGSTYELVGIDIKKDGVVGDLVEIQPYAAKYAHRLGAERDDFRHRVAVIVRGPVASPAETLDKVLTVDELAIIDAQRPLGTSAASCATIILEAREEFADLEILDEGACTRCGTRFGDRFAHHGGRCIQIAGKSICQRCDQEDAEGGTPDELHAGDINQDPAYRAAMIESGRGRLLR